MNNHDHPTASATPARWWDRTKRLKFVKNPTPALWNTVGLNRIQFHIILSPLGSGTTIDSLADDLYQQIQDRYTAGTDRKAELQKLRKAIVSLRRSNQQIIWNQHEFALPASFLLPNTTTTSVTTIASKCTREQKLAASEARQATNRRINADASLYPCQGESQRRAWLLAQIEEAGAEARAKVLAIALEQPLLLNNLEILHTARHLLSNNTLCQNVATLNEFVEGMAQRFTGLNKTHLGVLEPLFMKYKSMAQAQEALEETKEAFENASLGIEGPPGLLEEGVRQLGDSTRKKFEQMISHIIDDDDNTGKNLLLKALISSIVTSPLPSIPTVPSMQSMSPSDRGISMAQLLRHSIHAMGLSPLSTASNVGSVASVDSPSSGFGGFGETKGNNYNNNNNNNNNNDTNNNDTNNNDTNTNHNSNDGEAGTGGTERDENLRVAVALGHVLGVDGVAALLQGSPVGDKVASDVIISPLLNILIQRLRYILYCIAGKMLISQRSFRLYLLKPLNNLICSMSFSTMGMSPLGTANDFDVMNFSCIKRIMDATRMNPRIKDKIKDPRTGIVAVTIDQKQVVTEFAQLDSTHIALDERLVTKYPIGPPPDANEDVYGNWRHFYDEDFILELDVFMFRLNDGTFLNHRTSTSLVTHLTTIWLHMALWNNSESTSEFLRVAILGGNDDFLSLNYFFKEFNIFGYDDTSITIEVIWKTGHYKDRKVHLKFILFANVSDGKNVRYCLGQCDARYLHDLVGIGSMERLSRRKLISDVNAPNNGMFAFYPPITLGNEFLRTVNNMTKDTLINHGMRKELLKMNEILATVEGGHDALSILNDNFHLFMRTGSNLMCDICVGMLQIKNMSFVKSWLKAVGKQCGTPCSFSEQKDRLKLGAAKITYPGGAMIDLGNLIYIIYEKHDATSIFGNAALANVILKLHELFNNIAHAFLGCYEDLAARLPYVTRDLWIFISIRAKLFGSRRIMPTETDLAFRGPHILLKLFNNGLSGKKASMAGGETDNYWIKLHWALMSSQGGGIGANEPHTTANATSFTRGNELMKTALNRLMMSQLVVRFDIDERSEFKKTTVHREARRRRMLHRWTLKCVKKFPITEQARAALCMFFPNVNGEEEEEEEEEEEDDVTIAMPVLINLNDFLTNGPDSDVRLINVIDESASADEEESEGEQEEEEEGENEETETAEEAEEPMEVEVDEANDPVDVEVTEEPIQQEDQMDVEENVETAPPPTPVIEETEEEVIALQTTENFKTAKASADKKDIIVKPASMVFGSWQAQKNTKLQFTWANIKKSFIKDDVLLSMGFKFFSRYLVVEVSSLQMKQLKTEIGSHHRAFIPHHRIQRVVVEPSVNGNRTLKFHLFGPPSRFERKTWDGSISPNLTSTATVGRWGKPGGAFNLCAHLTNGTVQDAACSEQVLEVIMKDDNLLTNLLVSIRTFWIVPVLDLKANGPAGPPSPTEWDLDAAMETKGKSSEQYPMASKNPEELKEITTWCLKLLDFASIGDKKDEDCAHILYNTCFQCDAKVFVPNKTTSNPYPMASIKLENGAINAHYFCKMCLIGDQDTPGEIARTTQDVTAFKKNWGDINSSTRKRDDTKSF